MFCPYTFRLPSEQQPQQQQQQPANSGPSPSRAAPSSVATSTQNGANRSNQPVAIGAKPGMLPTNLDEFKVTQLSNKLLLQCIVKLNTLRIHFYFRLQSLNRSSN